MTEAGAGGAPWRPKLGCAGVGWIGEDRLRAVAEADVADIAAIADPDPARRDAACEAAPAAAGCADFDELLSRDLDGVMIASPSALHADQAVEIAARARNVGGSFFDFAAERTVGTRTEPLCEPPDAWGGRAAVAWARKLASGARFDPEAWHFVRVSRTLDRIYGRASGGAPCGS